MSGSRWTMAGGDLIDGRYVIVREIGKGGMGVVYEAFDRKLERQVALKFLDPGLIEDGESVSRFQREALAAGRIGHESICDVRDRGETDEGVPYIVMELLDGEPLDWVMLRERQLDPGRLGRLMIQALSALDAAHRVGIVHRDIKPENMFVTKTLEGIERLKILDFGISKFLSETVGGRLTRTGTVMGSPLYMSPEQASGSKDIDHRTDVWSVGVIMYESLTGREPFEGENYNQIMLSIITTSPTEPRTIAPDIPEPIEAVVLKAMSKDMDDRYQTAAAFSDALRGALEESGEDPSLIISDQRSSVPPPSILSEAERDGPTLEDEPPVSQDTVDELGDTVSADTSPPKRQLTTILLVVLTLIAIGTAVVALSFSMSGASSATPTETPTPSERADEDRAEPSESPPEPAEKRAQTKAPRVAVVKVEGLPDGARATFDSEPVNGSKIEGPVGTQGVLEIEEEGREPVQINLALEEGGVVDLAAHFEPSVTTEARVEEPPAAEEASEGEEPERRRDSDRRRHSKRESTRERDSRERRSGAEERPTPSDAPGSERAIKGRHGSPVFTDYPGTE